MIIIPLGAGKTKLTIIMDNATIMVLDAVVKGHGVSKEVRAGQPRYRKQGKKR